MSMTAAGIVSLIAGIASLIGGGISSAKKANDTNDQTAFARRLKEQQDEEEQKKVRLYNKDSRKAAISRAIGSQNVSMPRPATYSPTPEPPTPNPVDVGGIVQGVAGGVGQVAGGLSSMGYGNQPLNYQPVQTVSGTTIKGRYDAQGWPRAGKY